MNAINGTIDAVEVRGPSGDDARRGWRAPMRAAGRWAVTALAFPLGGLVAAAAVGPIITPAAAVVGGGIVGGFLGVAQAWVGGRSPRGRWILGSVAGGALGLLCGAAIIGYAHDPVSLIVQGAVSGLVIGAGQASALPGGVSRVVWPLATALAWAAGWATTVAAGVDVERGYAVFGASGAAVATLVTGIALAMLDRQAVRP